MGLCPSGVLSEWGLVRVGLCPVGLCLSGVMSEWGFVQWGYVRLPFSPQVSHTKHVTGHLYNAVTCGCRVCPL